MRHRWTILLSILLSTYFAYFNRYAVNVRFAGDEMMNLGWYWRLSFSQLALQQVLLWRNCNRPMGGVFYLTLWRIFGLNPKPFHIALLLILLAAVFLIYYTALLLDCSRPAAAIAALIACYHPGLSFLYFDSAFIYDALCGLFYLAAFAYYLRIRRDTYALNVCQLGIFLALYLCALNAKEMAVTLPALLLACEYTFQKRLSWTRGPSIPIALAALLNLVYIYGKVFAPNALAGHAAYRPVFSMTRALDFQRRSLDDLFLAWRHFHGPGILAVWLVVTCLAWYRPRRVLRFCWFAMLLTPLPIEFLEGRANACLFIPLVAWATFAAVIFTDLVALVSAGHSKVAWILLTAGVCLWANTVRDLQTAYIRSSMAELGGQTAGVIDQLRALRPHVRRGSTVVFLTDPFDGWDMAFIAELWFHDPSLRILLNRKTPLTAAELARADHVFTFEGSTLLQRK